MTKRTAGKRNQGAEQSLPSKAMMEQVMQRIGKLAEEQGVVTADDVKALMASLSGPSASDSLPDDQADAKDQAQEMAFDAMEAKSEAQARKLAKRALGLDPDCVDAIVVMTRLDARSPRAIIEGLQKAVAAGERSLGKQFIAENKGYFWLLLETRPYMRALGSLAEMLRASGIAVDAARIYERMLELNPNDNQGVRDPLLGLYLEFDDLKGAGRLLKEFEEDTLANFRWGRVLERFLAGDRAGAGAALKLARKANRHVELFLTQQKPLPKQVPEMYSPGSVEEAVLCLSHLSGAWANHQEAAMWLLDQLAAAGAKPVPSKPALARMAVQGKKPQ